MGMSAPSLHRESMPRALKPMMGSVRHIVKVGHNALGEGMKILLIKDQECHCITIAIAPPIYKAFLHLRPYANTSPFP